MLTENQQKIALVGENHTKFLLEKNKRYGDSALEPLGVFSKHIINDEDALNNLLIRCDDKLKRIKNADGLRKNDVADLIGYLKLICVNRNWLDFNDLID